MLPLYRSSAVEDQRAELPREKTEALRAQFFPIEPDIDLSDINRFEYRLEVKPLPKAIEKDVLVAIRSRPSFSTPRTNTIPNGFLKALGDPFI